VLTYTSIHVSGTYITHGRVPVYIYILYCSFGIVGSLSKLQSPYTCSAAL